MQITSGRVPGQLCNLLFSCIKQVWGRKHAWDRLFELCPYILYVSKAVSYAVAGEICALDCCHAVTFFWRKILSPDFESLQVGKMKLFLKEKYASLPKKGQFFFVCIFILIYLNSIILTLYPTGLKPI